MLVLDTDHVSLLEREESDSAQRIRERLRREPGGVALTTIITYEEQMRGWLVFVAKARKLRDQIQAFARLHQRVDNYRRIAVLPFDDSAGKEFERLRKLKLGIGTSDLRMAVICLSVGATLLTRNLMDFRQIPRLIIEDAAASL